MNMIAILMHKGVRLALIVCILLAVIASVVELRDKQSLVNCNNIRNISLGMTRHEVISILGNPTGAKGDFLEYYRSLGCSLRCSYLTISFLSNRVVRVYGKMYPLLGDDEGVYGLNEDYGHWETCAFAEAFP